jgi:hypothetical protein
MPLKIEVKVRIEIKIVKKFKLNFNVFDS